MASSERPRVLRDTELDRTLDDQGWVKLPGVHLGERDRGTLRRFFVEEFPGRRSGFHNDFFLPDPAFRIRATQVMAESTHHLAGEWFSDHRPFLYTYLTKFASESSSLLEHRDWMYVDELSGERSFILYVALDPTDELNGMLHLVPRSHRLDGPPCGTGLIWPWLGYSDVLRSRAVQVPLRAGEAVVWDNRLIHMSFENRSAVDRLAMGLWCHEAGGGLAHFVGRERGVGSRFLVDECFFMSETPALLAGHDPRYPEAARFRIRGGDHSPQILEHVLRGDGWPTTARPWTYEPMAPGESALPDR